MTPVLGARPNGAVQEGGGQMYRESPHLPCLVCLSVVTVAFQSCVCCSPSLMSFLHLYLAQEKDFARIRIFHAGFLSVVEIGQCFMTKDNGEQFYARLVVNTLFQEMMDHHNRKDGFRET